VGSVHDWSGKQEHKTISEQAHRARAKLVHLGQACVACKARYGLRWSARQDRFGHSEWRVAIDAFSMTAVVQPAKQGDEKYGLMTRLEGVLTTQLIQWLAGEPIRRRLAAASA
jgi:hypothetical protein